MPKGFLAIAYLSIFVIKLFLKQNMNLFSIMKKIGPVKKGQVML